MEFWACRLFGHKMIAYEDATIRGQTLICARCLRKSYELTPK